MSYGDRCDCARDVEHLKDQLRYLELELDRVRRDLERETEDRRSAIRMVADDLAMTVGGR